MNIKLEVNRYLNNDVIATSGHQTMSGMSQESYQLWADVCYDDACGWGLVGTSIEHVGVSFSYYDESGNKNDIYVNSCGWIDYKDNLQSERQNLNKWFHYDSEGNFQICNDVSHRHQSN